MSDLRSTFDVALAVVAVLLVGVALMAVAFARAWRRSDAEARRLGAIVDEMAARRAGDTRLRDSEARYRSLVDASTAIVWTADADGRFVPPQDSWSASTGQGPDAYAGDGWSAVIHPDDLARIEAVWRDALGAGAPVDTEVRIWSVASGAYRWYSARAVPRRNASGAVEEWVGACTDIHERRLTEIQLRESEQRARLALEIGRLGTWTWMPEGDALFADARCREICGFPADVGLQLGDLLARTHVEDRARVTASLVEARDASRPYAEEVRVVHADGTLRWVAARGDVVMRAGAAAPVLVGSMMDVTEHRLAEDALRRADREKDDFLALLAHELRNPLAPIRTAVQLLQTRSPSEEDGRRLHGVIDRQIQHLVRMVDDLLDVSRVLRGKVELRPGPVDMTDVVAIAVETSRPWIDAQRQELLVQAPARGVITVHGDQVRLAQVISNLLNNASKYTEKGGLISVTALAHRGQAVVKVTDSGAGIPPDILPRIFEPFVQADRTLERTRGGLGIGLTLVKKIVELHAGSVGASSRGNGLGSEFVIRLPLVAAPAPVEPEPAAPEPAVVTPARILVVDDNVDAAESLAMLLRASGHTVDLAHDGRSGLERLDRWSADVVILDVGLPGMSGYEVASQLRDRGDGAPELIAVTGYGQASDAQRAFAAGFRHHLVKPVDAAALQATIARALASRAHRADRSGRAGGPAGQRV